MSSLKTKTAAQISGVRELAARISSGDVIWLGSQLAISEDFLDALAERYGQLKNVTLVAYNLILQHELLTDERYKDSFKFVLFREEDGYVKVDKKRTNVSHRVLPEGDYKNSICRDLNINTLVTEVLPPDEDGNCNLGVHGRHVTSTIIDSPELVKKYAIANEMQSAQPEV